MPHATSLIITPTPSTSSFKLASGKILLSGLGREVGWKCSSSRNLSSINLTSRPHQPIRRRTHLLSIKAISSSVPWPENGEAESKEGAKEEEEVKTKRRRFYIAGVDQSKVCEPHLLADPDSRFATFHGVQIHHKIARPAALEGEEEAEGRLGIPAIMLHGFGASLFSWERVMGSLANMLGAPVLAFDRPGFGLTSRVFSSQKKEKKEKDLRDFPSEKKEEKKKKIRNSYTLGYSAAATLAFVSFLKAEQAVIIGHSAGSLVAIDAYFKNPEKIAAMVLVAPSWPAPLFVPKIAAAEKMKSEKRAVEEEDKKTRKVDILTKVWALVVKCWVTLMNILKSVVRFFMLGFSALLGFVFRSPPAIWLVQRIMDKGGPFAVRTAFYDVSKADTYILHGYTKPLQSRHWERALLEYCLALWDNSEDQLGGKRKLLKDVLCPVLVLTGDTDRFVPDWNSENLAKVFPHAEFKRIEKCGHLPHEETPEEFLEVIKDWLSRTLVKSQHSMEAAMG